jgi:hypothetical protein
MDLPIAYEAAAAYFIPSLKGTDFCAKEFRMNTSRQIAISGRTQHVLPGALLLAGLFTLGAKTSATASQKAATANGNAAAQTVTWTKFEDPFERSFSLEVPAGWTVRGGLFRLGYSD